MVKEEVRGVQSLVIEVERLSGKFGEMFMSIHQRLETSSKWRSMSGDEFWSLRLDVGIIHGRSRYCVDLNR